MNEPPRHHENDSGPEMADELISAALDDSLDDAAADLGLTRAQARSAIDRRPDRHDAMRAARDALAAPPPPLDEVTRRRLVSAAVAGAGLGGTTTRGRRHRMTASIAGIAAAVVVMAGVGVLLATGSDGPTDDSAGGESALLADDPVALEASADLGEVSDPKVLRNRLRKIAPMPAPAAVESDGSSSAPAGQRSAEDGA